MREGRLEPNGVALGTSFIRVSGRRFWNVDTPVRTRIRNEKEKEKETEKYRKDRIGEKRRSLGPASETGKARGRTRGNRISKHKKNNEKK